VLPAVGYRAVPSEGKASYARVSIPKETWLFSAVRAFGNQKERSQSAAAESLPRCLQRPTRSWAAVPGPTLCQVQE